jgi:hypothetical protein
MPFANPIIGGGGSLVYPSIHSPDFATGVSGWTINKDGTVEFNNGTFRGTVSAAAIIGAAITGGTISGASISGGTITGATFDGTNFIFNSSGLFIYTGTPASGNLLQSTAPANGTDAFGNTYYGPGTFFYSTSGDGGFIGFSSLTGGQTIMYMGNSAHNGANHVNAAFLELTVDTLNFGWSGNGGQVSLAAGNPGYFTVASPMFANGGTFADPTFITTDSWHDVGSMTASWSKASGFFKYKLLPGDGMVMVAAQGLIPGTVADGTTILAAANGLPTGYRPTTNKPIVADTNQIKVNAVGTGAFENARLNFITDGSVTCSGFGTAATFANCYGIFPLDI